jgi:hypothetical protein
MYFFEYVSVVEIICFGRGSCWCVRHRQSPIDYLL